MAEKREEYKDLDGTGLKPYHYMTDADIVNIEDKNNKIKATHVEGALEEIVDKIGILNGQGNATEKVNKNDFDTLKKTTMSQLADIGKQIGTTELPTTAKDLTGAVKELFQYVDNGKNSVYSAIVDKGTTPISKGFSDLVKGINNINTGKKYADGTGTMPLHVTNLNFQPRVVLICSNGYWYIVAKLPNNDGDDSVYTRLDGQQTLHISMASSWSIDTFLFHNGFMACHGECNGHIAVWYAWE